ncbi:MAG TPA: endonuclease/exonuclease/phosphatase [Cyanobacteria bacterium UBA8803]|nr:endonuclease/exonuclease/phosphatase [Cyanobacteria bacterium UBA9273]HBL57211.1 endonuclease/exonuclease/phosphatase [Cyanobacteria bacterium UBA8803]
MQLKLMTLNLRHDKPDPGKNAWTVRKEAVAAIITYHAPDIIGTQEGKAQQLLDLHRLLPDYQSIGGDRTGTNTGEYCAIFYRQDRLKCRDRGDFFLSDTPDVPGSISPNWGNPLPRMTSWAVFAVKGESKTVTCFNTHLDYKSAKARELGAKLICDRLTRLQPEDTYLFLTGDFNAEPSSLPREIFSPPLPNGLTLRDALAEVTLEHQLSFHNFTGQPFAAVDTIYYDSQVNLQQVKVDNSQWQGIWPSDHFPVIADFITGV